MTIKVGTVYIHTVLGYQDAQGAIVITEDTELATMTGRYVDNLPTASTDPDAYTWTELADPEEADDTEDDTSEGVEDTSSMLYRMAGTQMTEAIQDNLAVGTNQGASGWETATGTIAAAPCQPDGSAEAVNGVAWTATAGGTLLRTEHLPGEAVPETVTVSFWWLASAACGLTVSIGNNESETQYNHDSTDLDEDGNALDLTDAWLFFRALIPIAQTANDYAVRVATDSAATISICDFKVEPGDKVTAWTESAKAAMSAAQTADSKAQQADSKAQAADDKAQAAGDKATAAGEKAQAAGTTAQAVQTALAGLTKVQDGQVLIDGDKVYLSAAFVRSIFAKDITATGTITGAKLIGAVLSGEAIDISAANEHSAMQLEGKLEHASQYDFYKFRIENKNLQGHVLGESTSFIEFDGEMGGITISAPCVCIDDSSALNPSIYTISASGVVTSGTIRVVEKLGWCLVHGGITLSAATSDWITVLNAEQVPGTQHGEAIFKTIPYWGTSYGRPLRVAVMAAGGLRIRYGSKGEFQFDFCYPIN